jgi:hypothetical protein
MAFIHAPPPICRARFIVAGVLAVVALIAWLI